MNNKTPLVREYPSMLNSIKDYSVPRSLLIGYNNPINSAITEHLSLLLAIFFIAKLLAY